MCFHTPQGWLLYELGYSGFISHLHSSALIVYNMLFALYVSMGFYIHQDSSPFPMNSRFHVLTFCSFWLTCGEVTRMHSHDLFVWYQWCIIRWQCLLCSVLLRGPQSQQAAEGRHSVPVPGVPWQHHHLAATLHQVCPRQRVRHSGEDDHFFPWPLFFHQQQGAEDRTHSTALGLSQRPLCESPLLYLSFSCAAVNK